MSDPIAPAPRGTAFTRVVDGRFASWDRDADGTLSLSELDALVADPRVTGNEAAAVATLKLVFARRAKFGASPLRITRDYLNRYAAAPRSWEFPAFDLRFQTLSRRIHATRMSLFKTAAMPRLEDIQQGVIGDCYYLAVVGGLIHRDPAQVRHMIAQNVDGSYDVTFPTGRKAHVAPITDAELALSSDPKGSGRWLPVLEAAFGAVRETPPGVPLTGRLAAADSIKTDAVVSPAAPPRLATDVIRNGGSIRQTIRLITGHLTSHLTLRPADSQVPPAPETVAPKLSAIREAVTAALKDKRLIGAGTNEADRPPDITPKHAYAVIGYDPATDMITLWNPHGEDFAPVGAPGLRNGYVTRNGVLSMPMIDFARTFIGLNWELDTPAPVGREQPQ